MSLSDENYPVALDRFDELWSAKDLNPNLVEELESLADLISVFEQIRYPLINDPTYRDLLNDRIRRQACNIR